MSGRVLFWGSGSIPCWKVMLVLAEKRIEYTSKLLSFMENGPKSPEVLSLNLRGQVPTFKDGDTVICESTAICLYLETTYQTQGTQLLPLNCKQRAHVLQKAFEVLGNLQPVHYPILDYIWDVKEEDWDQKYMKAMRDKLKVELQIWEKYLSQCGSEFLAGNEFTLADVFFFPFVAWLWRMSVDFTKFPNIKNYFDRLKERPSIQSTWPPHWKEGDPQPKRIAVLKTL